MFQDGEDQRKPQEKIEEMTRPRVMRKKKIRLVMNNQ